MGLQSQARSDGTPLDAAGGGTPVGTGPPPAPTPSVAGTDDPADGRRGAAERWFRDLYERRYGPIYGYVARRIGAGTAEVPDLVAEVFAVTWRRRRQVPEPPADLPWLYGVARRIVSRHGRTLYRRSRLHERLAGELRVAPGDRDPGPEVLAVRAAMDRLRTTDQEVLRLVLWEQLSHAEAAVVLRCSVNAVALRLHRARQRLAEQLAGPAGGEPKEEGDGPR